MKQDFLDIFKLRSKSKKVLLDIIGHGTSSVAEIANRLAMPKSSVYDAVTSLLDMSLINEYSSERGKTFGISDREQLTRVHNEKITELQQAQNALLSFINTRHKTDTTVKPRIKFYSGTLGIKQAFRDMPWQKDLTETYMVWPTKGMIDIDEDFFKWHGTQRFKYGVFIYAIETHSDRSIQKGTKHAWLKNDAKNNLVDVKYLPKGVNCKMSFWLYGDKCLFASSVAFTVHSHEFASMMKLLWDGLWAQAKR